MIFDGLHKGCIFRQEAVAGVDRLCASDFAGGDDCRKRKVALRRRGWSDANSFVRHPHMHGIRISGGVDGNRFHAKFAAGADDAQRNLASVRDENFIEHVRDPIR